MKNIFKNLISEDTLMKMSRSASKLARQAKKSSPTIMMVFGSAAIIGGAIVACKATLKSEPVVAEAKKKVNDIQSAAEEADAKEERKAEAKKEIRKVYAQTGLAVAKNYGPAVFLIGGGLGCMFGSHYIMGKRNATLAAAYVTVDKAFREYKSRVEKTYGPEIQKTLEHGIEKATNPKNDIQEGKEESPATPELKVVTNSPYAFIFDEYSPLFCNTFQENMNRATAAEQTLNRRLGVHDTVVLNEVFDLFGLPRTPVGAVVGWKYDPNGGTHQVDLGLGRMAAAYREAIDNGWIFDQGLLIDPNTQGAIY